MEKLLKKIEDLKTALENKTISVNEYSSMYHETHKQIKKLNKY